MPSVNSRSMPKVCDSSTLTTPSLPTLSMASAITLPTSSERAEIAPTRAISSLPLISVDWPLIASTACATAFHSSPQYDRVGTSGHVLEALADDDLGQNCRRGRPVTRDIVGLGRDFLDELRALVLEDVLELDLARDRHTIIGDRRRPELLVEHHVLALGT